MKTTKTITKSGIIFAALIAASTFSGIAEASGGKSGGDFMVRARAITTLPQVDSTVSVVGGQVEVDDTVLPEIDFTWFLTDNIGLELVLGTTRQDVGAKATAFGDLDLGTIWLLPPTVMVQYHFRAKEKISPYIGTGINYTVFYNDDLPGPIVTDIKYDNAFGLAFQAGVDIHLKDNWYFNLDAKKLLLRTDVFINGGTIEADVELNPWILGAGIGYKF